MLTFPAYASDSVVHAITKEKTKDVEKKKKVMIEFHVNHHWK